MPAESHLPELLLRWEELRNQGQHATPEDLCAECPEHLDELRRRIAALRVMDARLDVTSDAPVDQSATSTLPPTSMETGGFHEPNPSTSNRPRSTGRYEVLRSHARGGLGEVFVAQDTELHRPIALKCIQDRHAGSAESRRRFLVEAEITARLEHPGIVPVYGLVTNEQGQPSYAMRFIEGESLHEAIQRFHESRPGDKQGQGDKETPRHGDQEGALSSSPSHLACLSFASMEFRQLLQRLTAVCNTIAYAHSRGVIHRDIKPANIMLGKYNETLVVDWGLAKVLNAGSDLTEERESPDPVQLSASASHLSTQPGSAIGTPAFMSPEQAAGRWDMVGPPSDIYSLGATLFVMLTGQVPFTDTNLGQLLTRVQRGDFSPPRAVRRGVPAALDAVCLKAMALEPEARYASALELASDVERWLADEAVSAHREPLSARVGRWARKHRTLVTSAALAVLLLTMGAAVSIYQWRTAATEQAQLRHEHLASIRQTAEAQEQIGLAALRGNRWHAAAQLFEKALEPLADEPEVGELHERVAARLRRTQRLLRYQQFEQQMTESVVLDLEKETVAALEQALAQFEVFGQARWWEALPDEDLTPRQRELLRLDVHGHMLMLAAVQARRGFMHLGNPAKAKEACHRGLEVLSAAQAFERTITGDFMEYYCRLGSGQLAAGTKFEGARTPVLFADCMFLGTIHQWLSSFGEDPLTRFFVQSINSPLLDLKTPLATSERYLRTAINLYPDYPMTYALMTDTLYRGKKYGEAEFSARTQVALSPQQPLAYRMLAMNLLAQANEAPSPELKQGLLKQALQEADVMAEVGGFRWQDCYFRSQLRLEADANAPAVTDLEKTWELLLKESPTHSLLPEVQNKLGVARQNLGQLEQALAHYTEALRLYPKDLVSYSTPGARNVYLNRADVYVDQKNYPAALADLDAAIKLQPSADAYNTRARVCLLNGKLDQAVDDAGRAIRLAPKRSLGYLRRGEAYLRKGEIARALTDCDKALELNPKATLVHELRGRAHAIRGDLPAAAAEFRALIQKDPKSSNGRFWLGVVLIGQNDLSGYRQVCAESLELLEKTADPSLAEDMALLCSYGPGGGADPARVLVLAERLLKGSKKNRERLALGVAYLRAGRLTEAQECFQQSYPTPRPDKPWVTATLFRGLCAHQLGQAEEARRWLEPARQWHLQFAAAVRTGDLRTAPRFDSLGDWQSRILVESIVREVEK